jgi:uncharacterized protein
MRNVLQKLSSDDASALAAFLVDTDRPKNTLRFHELQGFLFAIASSPETIPPSEWLPLISNDEDIGFKNETEAQRVLSHIMTLYNQVNCLILERSDALPFGCEFLPDTLANFDEHSSISQWSRGFMIGHDWLSEVWDAHLPEFMDDECGANTLTLSFFSSRQLAEAYHAELGPTATATSDKSLEQFADKIRELFPLALSAYAHLGRTIFEALMEDAAYRNRPASSAKIGRNDTCPCGSGKKYKKCCAGQLH